MTAVFSECSLYRYRLDRDLGRVGPKVAVIGVNPSKADAIRNDQTVSKDEGFGATHGWGWLIKANVFAYRSTDIKGLAGLQDPVGPENMRHLREIMEEADQVVAAWGTLDKLPHILRGQWRNVADLADEIGRPLYCLGTVQSGHPRHTMTTGYATPLTIWKRPA